MRPFDAPSSTPLRISAMRKVLIELARKETDLAMKKRIVERLSQMKSPEATDYFMEILAQP